MSKLRIVFMGTPDFAVASLKALVEADYDVVAVITAPDRPKGRGQRLSASPVKEYASERGIDVLQPTNLKSEAFLDELRSYAANLQVVVAFRMLPEVVWSMPELGTFNLHASLLPRYRGAAPINWAIINGEKETGATTFFLQHEIDTGEIILQKDVAIENEDTAGDLHDKLMELGAQLVVDTTHLIETGSVRTTPQPHTSDMPDAPKIFRETCQIDWSQDAERVYNKIRGLSPYPAAWAELGESTYKIFSAKIDSTLTLTPGEVRLSEERLWVGTSTNALEIIEVQKQGKKRMMIRDFLKGNTI